MPSVMLAAWVHNLDPFLIHFSGNIGIRYYGLAYVLAFAVGAWLLVRYAKAGRSPVPAEKVWDLLIALMVGVYVGGRVGHFILYGGLERMKEDPFSLFRVWEGGMAFHGGLVGVGLAVFLYARWIKQPFFALIDIVVTLVPSGLLLGRLANFINGELWGTPAQVPWAIIFPLSGTLDPRHPSQLYEALLEGLLLFVLVQWRFWKTDVVAKTPGRLSGEFCIVYGLLRSFCELFREPDSSLLFGLSRGTVYSFAMVLVGLFVLRFSRSTKKT